ncbi:MAG: ABC transporter substrate-binding protein [Pseudolabrys sp.]|nr:ABC transporter substrate-binding protein [Pseudolabrys sp.]
MTELNLTLACLPYDRFQPLLSGEIPVDGTRIAPVPLRWPIEVFSRMLAHNEFDIAEMSIVHSFVYTAKRTAQFSVLPIFPSRMFRHGFIFINKTAGIRSPRDLAGRRIGIQGHQTAASIWIRGILRSDYGVDFDNVSWFEGGVNQKGLKGGHITMLKPRHPPRTQPLRDDQMLSDMLATGEIDALISPEIPASLRTSDNVERLFPDYQAEEKSYFARTGIFPIMHTLVIRKELHEQHPWLAASLYKACDAAKTLALKQARYSGAPAYMLPWMFKELEEMDAVFGADPWPYGLAPNRTALETVQRFLVEESFLDEPMRIDDVFLPAGDPR